MDLWAPAIMVSNRSPSRIRPRARGRWVQHRVQRTGTTSWPSWMTRKRTSTSSSYSPSIRWSVSNKMRKALRFSITKIRSMCSLNGWIRVMAPTWSRIKSCKAVLEEYALTRKILIKGSHKGSVETCVQVQPLLLGKLAGSFQISSPNASRARYTTRTNSTTFHIPTSNPLPWWTIWCQRTRVAKHWDSYLRLHPQTSTPTKLAKVSTAIWGSLVPIAIQTPWFNKNKRFFKDHLLQEVGCHERKLDPNLRQEIKWDLPKNLRALRISPTKKLSRIWTWNHMFQTVWKIRTKKGYMRRKSLLKRLWIRCKWKISNWGPSFKINRDKFAKRMKWCNRSWKTCFILLILKIQLKISCRNFRGVKSTTHQACLRTFKNQRWRFLPLVPCRK